VPLEHVELMRNAHWPFRRIAGNRARKVLSTARLGEVLYKAGGILGVDRDIYSSHRVSDITRQRLIYCFKGSV